MQLRGQYVFTGIWTGTFQRGRTADRGDVFPDRAPEIATRWVWSKTTVAFAAITVLISLRFVLAAVLPLSFDEAYYWLWSKHLALGYLEHPAVIAFVIRAGTLLFGNTEFGVRFVPLLASICASWAVWRGAAIILSDEAGGAIACLFFNATLMIAAEGMGATPDSLLIAAAAMLLWAVAELERSQDGRWWLAVGVAAGAGIASKYTGIFLCADVVVWLLVGLYHRLTQKGTIWLQTIWPYAGAAFALTMFAPALYWNANHGFISFRFEGDRVLAGHPGPRYLLEFLGSQLALASPGILTLAAMISWQALRFQSAGRPLAFVFLACWLPGAYFVLHAFHDRVQGNWPCFVYPALAILAAKGFREIRAVDGGPYALRFVRASAIPVAGLILGISYVQAFSGVIPLGRSDPIARMTAVGLEPVVRKIAIYAAKNRVRAIVTTNYPVTAWLRFYGPPQIPVVQITDDDRFLSSFRATKGLLTGRLLYVTQRPWRELPFVRAHFSAAELVGTVWRSRNGREIDEFAIYIVQGLREGPLGRIP